MNPNEPILTQASPEALFRYQVVSQVKSLIEAGHTQTEAIEETAELSHATFDGRWRKASGRTVYRWYQAYLSAGIKGLEPNRRQVIDDSQVLPAELLKFMQIEKKADPLVSIPELLRKAHILGVVKPHIHIDRVTAYRACKRMNLTVARGKLPSESSRDTRRFAYPNRMDMVLSDGKFFRAGVSRAQRVVLFFLDDATRFGLHAVVGTSENTTLFLRGLYETLRKYGLMGIFYLDRGPGFRSLDTMEVMQKLTVALILGEKAYPEGHGKIERFHQTAFRAVLRGLDYRPDVNPDCRSLELRLQHYLREVYNHLPHESLNQQTPAERFHQDQKALRFSPDEQSLRENFVLHIKRRVSADHVVSVDSTWYEMPRGTAGLQVVLRKNVLDNTLAFLHEGRLVELQPLDLAANARSRRAKPTHPKQDVVQALPKSAADLLYERDLAPLVGPDGGFVGPPNFDFDQEQ